jgi:hypothetical protein
MVGELTSSKIYGLGKRLTKNESSPAPHFITEAIPTSGEIDEV